MFDDLIEGVDQYNHQGSLWLILTDERKWILEFTKTKTLWYNYTIFKDRMSFAAMDCVENKEYITKWFESRFLNKPKAQDTLKRPRKLVQQVEDAIENGVKDTEIGWVKQYNEVEDTIQNGVKRTLEYVKNLTSTVEDTIQNGVKETIDLEMDDEKVVEYFIENGVKHTSSGPYLSSEDVEYTIQNGVKETTPSGYLGSIEMKGKIVHQIESPKQNNEVEDTIQNGVKETQTRMWPPVGAVDETIQNGVKEAKEDRLFRTIRVVNAIVNGVKHVEDGDWLDQDERIDDIIENGVKETKESMLESLEQIDHQVTNCEITESINDAIEKGVKETKEISNISLMSEMFKVKAKQAIRDGVKELKVWKSNRCEEHGYFELVDGIPTYTPMIQVKDVLENGVKELKELPDKSGEFRGYGDWYRRQGNMTKPHTEYVKEVIEDSYNHRGRVEGIIRNTDKDGI
jgi:predicted transcriptional regulator